MPISDDLAALIPAYLKDNERQELQSLVAALAVILEDYETRIDALENPE